MRRGTVKLLTLAAGFVVMTAGTCPAELCDFLPPGPREECLASSPELSETSDDTQPELAVGEEPSEVSAPELATPEPEPDKS